MSLKCTPEDQKRVATLRARAALVGVALHAIDGDRGVPIYVASRWAMTRQFESLSDLESWLDRVTGKRSL